MKYCTCTCCTSWSEVSFPITHSLSHLPVCLTLSDHHTHTHTCTHTHSCNMSPSCSSSYSLYKCMKMRWNNCSVVSSLINSAKNIIYLVPWVDLCATCISMYARTHMHTVICKCKQMLLHKICKSFLKINNYLKRELSFKAGAPTSSEWLPQIIFWWRVKGGRSSS